MTDDTVRDEVAGPGRDVEHRSFNAERLDRLDSQRGIALDRYSFYGSLPGDCRVDRVEEAELLTEATIQTDVHDGLGASSCLEYVEEAELPKALGDAPDDLGIRVADPKRDP